MIEVKGNYNVYRNVYFFIERLRVIQTTKMALIVARNLHLCLMGTAHSWYINDLPNWSKQQLHAGTIKQWCEALEQRFGDSARQILIKPHQIQNITADPSPRFIQYGTSSQSSFSDRYPASSSSDGYPVSSSRSSQNGSYLRCSSSDYSNLSANKTYGRNPETKTEKNFGQSRSADCLRRPRRNLTADKSQYCNICNHALLTDYSEVGDAHFFSKINKAKTVATNVSCNQCYVEFESNNKFHQHRQTPRPQSTDSASIDNSVFSTIDELTAASSAKCTVDETINADIQANLKSPNPIDSIENTHHILSVKAFPEKPQFITSSAPAPKQPKGYGFRGWRYASCRVALTKTGKLQSACIDSGCTISLIDRKFLKANAPDAKIMKMNSLMTVKGLGSVIHQADKFVIIDLYLPTFSNKVAHMSREFHLVDDLKVNMIIGIDIMVIEGMILNLPEHRVILTKHQDEGTQLDVPINIIYQASRIRKSIFGAIKTVIFSNSHQMIDIKGPKGKYLKLPKNPDLLFEP